MRFLVDTNVLSEPTKSAPNKQVCEWLTAHEGEIAVDAIVFAELALGVESLAIGRRRRVLQRWLADVQETLTCLAWDAASAMCWARLVTALKAQGRSMSILDSQIAATALARGLTIATRNTQHFRFAGVDLVNPFA